LGDAGNSTGANSATGLGQSRVTPSLKNPMHLKKKKSEGEEGVSVKHEGHDATEKRSSERTHIEGRKE